MFLVCGEGKLLGMLYVKTTLTIPGASATHVAELREVTSSECEMVRIVALAPQGIAGAATKDTRVGNIDMPSSKVPHPDTYGDFPDISAEHIVEAEFESLWERAKLEWPGLA